MQLIRSLVLSIAVALAGTPAVAHEPATASPPRVLGQLQFPTSSKVPAAQSAFLEGMLYLHLFEYRSAEEAFERALKLDPGMAMAAWGEAATYTHPVWNQQDLEAGRAALAKIAPTPAARAAKVTDARERAFLRVAEGWYGAGEKPARDAAALAAAEELAKAFPKDDEAQLFLALTLLGANQGERNLPRFLRAAEISRAVYAHNPQHPGAAHYWIHGMDDPQHAAGALEAAHALSKIAPDAGHSQHMTSHIFIALGRWQDVVDANVAAMRVVGADQVAKAQPVYACGHYVEWLQYAYLQQGKEAEAWKLLSDCERSIDPALAWMRARPGTMYLSARTPDMLQELASGSLSHMRMLALVDSPAHRAELLAATGAGTAPTGLLLARGLAALESGQDDIAQSALADLQALAAAAAAEATAGSDPSAYPRIMARMLQGAREIRAGRSEPGFALLRAAADDYDALPFDFGPPATVKPPRELLGELLLAAGRRDEARAEFERALASAPERARSLAGRAQAGEAPH